MHDETPLAGGTHGAVVRVGATVRRLPYIAMPAVHAVLRHLEAAGFGGAPRALGVDEQGREILSFVPGIVVGQRGQGVPPAIVRSEQTLTGVARLLRGLHEATAGFVPPPDAPWAFQVGAPRAGDVICHNDIGPWNTVFRDGVPVAFIDFDTAAPAPRVWDVAYALYRFVPYQPDEVCTLIGWPAPPDRPHRLKLFLDAYGLERRDGILETVARRIEVMEATGMALYMAGDSLYGPEWARVMRPRLLRDIAFVRSQPR